MKVTYSYYINKAVEYLKAEGFTVKLLVFDLPVAGQIHYHERLIEINEPSACHALMTLAHEGGHWLSFKRYGDVETLYPKAQRERFAYLFGWYVLRLIGADKVISKKEWNSFHD